MPGTSDPLLTAASRRRSLHDLAALCRDCAIDVIGIDERYMVHDPVWAAAGMSPWGGFLCVGCIENRLRRQLRPNDFNDAPMNTAHDYPRSWRLACRLSGVDVQAAGAGRPGTGGADVRRPLLHPAKVAAHARYWRAHGRVDVATRLETELTAAGRCYRCGHTLTDPLSVERGVGPDCFVKLQDHENRKDTADDARHL